MAKCTCFIVSSAAIAVYMCALGSAIFPAHLLAVASGRLLSVV